MKKLTTLVVAAAMTAATAAPLAAQEQPTNNPFVSTQSIFLPLLVIGGTATVIAVVASTGTD